MTKMHWLRLSTINISFLAAVVMVLHAIVVFGYRPENGMHEIQGMFILGFIAYALIGVLVLKGFFRAKFVSAILFTLITLTLFLLPSIFVLLHIVEIIPTNSEGGLGLGFLHAGMAFSWLLVLAVSALGLVMNRKKVEKN